MVILINIQKEIVKMNTTLVCKDPYEHWGNKDAFYLTQIEIEEGLISRFLQGAIEQKQLIVAHVIDQLFADKILRAIFELCSAYIAKYGLAGFNASSLILSLDEKSQKYAAYIKALQEMYTCSADTKNYIVMLHISYKKRMGKVCTSVDEFDQVREMLNKLALRDTAVNLSVTSAQYLFNFDEITKSMIKTYFKSIDDLIGGLLGGTLMLIAASTGMGKTVFTLNLIVNMAKHNKKILFFCLEMTPDELLCRIMASRAGLNSANLRNRTLSDWELEKYTQYADSAEFDQLQSNISIHGEFDMTIDDIAAVVRKTRADIIFLDYLQLVKCTKGNTRYEAVTEISRRLKLLANEVNKPIVVLSQLNRELKNRADKRPVLSDIRDSGSIEQDFDIVSFLYRPSYFDPKRDKRLFEVIFAKSRHTGAAGKTAHLMFDGAHQRITDPQGETQEEIKQCSMKY